jgi:hypothetical protein
MTQLRPWGFYGRQNELTQLRGILSRQRWLFVQIAGRRRIGKTSLIQQALTQTGRERSLYIQIPDSDPAGVLSACNDYLQTFGITERVQSLAQLAQLISKLDARTMPSRQTPLVTSVQFKFAHIWPNVSTSQRDSSRRFQL